MARSGRSRKTPASSGAPQPTSRSGCSNLCISLSSSSRTPGPSLAAHPEKRACCVSLICFFLFCMISPAYNLPIIVLIDVGPNYIFQLYIIVQTVFLLSSNEFIIFQFGIFRSAFRETDLVTCFHQITAKHRNASHSFLASQRDTEQSGTIPFPQPFWSVQTHSIPHSIPFGRSSPKHRRPHPSFY